MHGKLNSIRDDMNENYYDVDGGAGVRWNYNICGYGVHLLVVTFLGNGGDDID